MADKEEDEEQEQKVNLNEWVAVVGELVATSIFVFMCCASICVNNTIMLGEAVGNTSLLTSLAMIQGFAYVALLFVTVTSSSFGVGFLNPAITIGCLLTNRTTGIYNWHGSPAIRAVLFVVAQCIGGIGGAVLVKVTIPDADMWVEKFGTPRFGYGALTNDAFLVEMMGTFFLTWVAISNFANRARNSKNVAAPLAVGFAYTALNVFGHNFSGGSFNPIRAFAPYLIAQGWKGSLPTEQIIVLIFAPVVGAAIAAVMHAAAFANRPLHNWFGFNVPDDWRADGSYISAVLPEM